MLSLLIVLMTYLRSFLLSRHRLALENVALRQPLVVWKRKRPRPRLRRFDRLFWVALRQLWPGWPHTLLLVQPETIVSWHRAGFRLFCHFRSRLGKPGRPPLPEELRQLIRRLKIDNPSWGAPRLHGELLQLGFDLSEPTVSRYLRTIKWRCDAQKAKRWRAFLHNHREVIAAMDFFTVPTLSFRVLSCFFVIEHGRRQILHFNTTAHPTSEWIVKQLREAFPFPSSYRYVILDRDAKFSLEVLESLTSSGLEPIRTSMQSP